MIIWTRGKHFLERVNVLLASCKLQLTQWHERVQQLRHEHSSATSPVDMSRSNLSPVILISTNLYATVEHEWVVIVPLIILFIYPPQKKDSSYNIVFYLTTTKYITLPLRLLINNLVTYYT